MHSKPIILAPTSPRRIELLKKLRIKFKVASNDYPEVMDRRLAPAVLAKRLSKGKALSVASKYPNHLVIAADTFVILNHHYLGKPHSQREAVRMLKLINGHAVTVLTGFTILDTETHQSIVKAVKTIVHMRHLTTPEIHRYVKTKEPLDKAGAFAIQELGSAIVERIDGDFFNIMGLPLCPLAKALKEFGVNVLTQQNSEN